ncbi:MAG: hypothetical protein H6R08_2231, partial [Proteobacteria bacterium]|nr:hypothetical protein [Pseudomonadota bacterium]
MRELQFGMWQQQGFQQCDQIL